LATTAEAERDGLPAPGADSSGGTDDMFAGVGGKVDGNRLKSNLQLLALRFCLVFGILDMIDDAWNPQDVVDIYESL
jgi:hypothetical protein